MPDALTGEVLRGPTGPQIGAFFDYDGTVIDGFSAGAFYKHRIRTRDIGPSEAARTLILGLRGVGDDSVFADFMAMALKAWEGRAEDELEELGERLWYQEIAGRLHQEAWQLIQAHKLMGHTVVLASSATKFQVGPAGRELGVDHVLCSPVESEDGILTGRAGGDLLWGKGKANAVRKLAEQEGIDLAQSYCYSNGAEDVPFLETCGNPRPTNPEPPLEQLAMERGWPYRHFTARKGSSDLSTIARTVGMYGGLFTGFATGFGLGLLNRSHRQGVDLACELGGDLALALGGIKVNVQGAENLWSHRPAVFIINHQSQIDVPVMLHVMRGGFTGAVKKEVKSMPLFGQFFTLAGAAFIDRANTANAKEALQPAVDKLRDGISLCIAPEGTRTITPKLSRFKKGAFHVAMQAEVPIVPVVLRNAGEAWWRNSRTVQPGATVDVYVGEPIDVSDWKVEELTERVQGVQDWYERTLARWPGSPADRLVDRASEEAVS